jgi:phosphatidylglycerol:prolipoprotein diacylglycerol transferase
VKERRVIAYLLSARHPVTPPPRHPVIFKLCPGANPAILTLKKAIALDGWRISADMKQVLFWIPLSGLSENLPDIPIYGYGAMLFVAFVLCTWLACRLAAREGIAPQRIQDLAIWLFISGIAGARITFMIQYDVPIWQFFKIWDGGLVFYGSAIGGAVGYFLAYFLVLRRHGISNWKMADIIAPCAALGLALGRFGCLFNGCCYGNVACPDCPAISFPLAAPPRFAMVEKGYQTAVGFTLANEDAMVAQVEPGSPAYQAGLRDGDKITRVNGQTIDRSSDLDDALSVAKWPRGKNDVVLSVKHRGSREETTLPAFTPWTIGLNPTQLYESISMFLLFALLLAYYPFRRHDGEVMVLYMVGYAVHRFFNEVLRVDTDPVWGTPMTLSQNISVLVLLAAAVLGLILWRKPVQYPSPGAAQPSTSAASEGSSVAVKQADTVA